MIILLVEKFYLCHKIKLKDDYTIANSLQKSFFFVGDPLRYASENKALAKPCFNIANPFYNGLAIYCVLKAIGVS